MEIEIKRIIIEERFFSQAPRKKGVIPIAPLSALMEYRELQHRWLNPFPRIEGIEPALCLRPAKTTSGYVLTRELSFILSRLN